MLRPFGLGSRVAPSKKIVGQKKTSFFPKELKNNDTFYLIFAG